jgi:hypothetical protein
MYVQFNNEFSIIKTGFLSEDITPRVGSFSKIVDERTGNENLTMKVKFYCPIDVLGYLNSPCSSIEIRLASNDIEYYRNLSKTNISDIIETNVNPRLRTSIGRSASVSNTAAAYKSQVTNEIVAGLFNNTKLLGHFEMPSKEKIIRWMNIQEKYMSIDSSNFAKSLNYKNLKYVYGKENSDAKKEFKNNYITLVKQGNDPLAFFENSYGKTSFELEKGGSFTETSLKLNGFEKYLKTTFDYIAKEIERQSSKQNIFKQKKDIKPVRNLETYFKMSKNTLELFGQDLAHVLLIAKNEDGMVLQTDSYPIVISQILNQIDNLSSTSYTINSARNNINGVSKLLIGNNDNQKCDITVYAKSLSSIDDPEQTFFKKVKDSLVVEPKSKVQLYDGEKNYKNGPNNFPIGKNIIYRTTFNYKGKNFDNAKTTYSKSLNRKNENLPTCILSSKIINSVIHVTAHNLSSNIVSCRLLKYRYKGNVLGSLDFIENKNGIKETSYNKVKNDKSIEFEDYDVFDGKKYKYVLECILKNGERKTAISNSCIERYESRQGVINITPGRVRKTSKINDPETGEYSLATKAINDNMTITVSFDVERKLPQFEGVVKNFFANQVQAQNFEQEIQDLRHLEGFIYSYRVEKFDTVTGISEHIIDIETEENKTTLEFEDTVNMSNNLYYKITPRVKPKDELIRSIENIAFEIVNSERFSQINYASLAIDTARISEAKKLVSSVNNKYNLNNTLKRGLIIDEASRNPGKNIDLFYDASTGDIEYIDVNSNQLSSHKNLSIEFFRFGEIQELMFDNSSQSFDLKKRKFKKRKFAISFKANQSDYDIDFYAVFVKEESKIYIDGAIHSKDTFKNSNEYNYLFESIGSKGDIEIFLVPITKQGLIMSPRLLYKTFL